MQWLLLLASMTDAQFQNAMRHSPPDVRAVAERWQGCNHWAGEEPYDKDRERQILAAANQLRCTVLERDDATLRRKYQGRHDLIGILNEAQEAGY